MNHRIEDGEKGGRRGGRKGGRKEEKWRVVDINIQLPASVYGSLLPTRA
jgi:hypothetical protein